MTVLEGAHFVGTGQHGRLFIGFDFVYRPFWNEFDTEALIWVLPPGGKWNGRPTCPHPDALLVYGQVKKRKYGWLHEGPWQDAFWQLVKDKQAEEAAKAEAQREARLREREEVRRQVAGLVTRYLSDWKNGERE